MYFYYLGDVLRYDDSIMFTASMAVVYFAYFFIKRIVETNKEQKGEEGSEMKRIAWIIMFFSSCLLSIVGVIYATICELNNGWTFEFIYNEDRVSRFVMFFFLSANICDLLIGWQYYRKHLDPITTIGTHFYTSIHIFKSLIHSFLFSFLVP
jgi:hypothetical protein